jgi:hypothetical protein
MRGPELSKGRPSIGRQSGLKELRIRPQADSWTTAALLEFDNEGAASSFELGLAFHLHLIGTGPARKLGGLLKSFIVKQALLVQRVKIPRSHAILALVSLSTDSERLQILNQFVQSHIVTPLQERW